VGSLAEAAIVDGGVEAALRASAACGAALASVVVGGAAVDHGTAGPQAGVDPSGAIDAALLGVLAGRSVQRVEDVVELMARIDAILPAGDGLKAFNTLYRMVTEHVRDATTFEDRPWILTLDVLFADLYFDGVTRCLRAPDTAPTAWRVLMDRRAQRGIGPLQFALAGMSAHIERDLAVALVNTFTAAGPADRSRTTPEWRDYLRINDVLDAVEPAAMAALAAGLVRALDAALEPVDGWAAMELIHVARSLAWGHGVRIFDAGLASTEGARQVAALDTLAADAARAALVAIG
jgi:hypothetical protein